MSLTSPVPNPATGIAFTAVGQLCFYCETTILTDPAVHWHGVIGSIYFHPACVFPLFIRLARDLHELERPDAYRSRP